MSRAAQPAMTARAGGDPRAFPGARPACRPSAPPRRGPQRPIRPASQGTRRPGPPSLAHRRRIAVARPSSCPSSPGAGLAVVGAVTSRPLGLGGREKGERKKKTHTQESVNCACARASAGLLDGSRLPLPPPPGSQFLGPAFSRKPPVLRWSVVPYTKMKQGT